MFEKTYWLLKMKAGDLVRFQQTGQLIHRIGDYPEQEKYWTIGLCLSYDKIQGIVKILYCGKIIRQPKWSVEKAGEKDVQFRRPYKTR